MKLAVASLFVLALLGAHAQAYFNLADLADEDVGDEFRRSKN